MKIEIGNPEEQQGTVIVVGDGLSGALKALGEALVIVFARIFDEVKPVIENTLEAVRKIYTNYIEWLEKSEELARKKAAHKLDFSRPKIVHQVMCRKPKLIRKIIH